MTTYNLILFLHVLSVFGIVVSFSLEGASLSSLQHSCTWETTRDHLKAFVVLPCIGGPSFLVALLSGIYLWESAWRGSSWTVIALISLVAIAVIGAVLTGPGMASLGEEGQGEAGSNSTRMPVLWASFQVRAWIVIGIAFLMIMKPGIAGSVVTMAVAILIGLSMSPAMVSYYRSRNLCAVYRRKE